MSDRRAFIPDRALGQQYAAMMAAIRSTARRGAWPSPVQIDVAATPLSQTPSPSYIPSFPSYNTEGASLLVADLIIPQGRWYVVATSSQRFFVTPGSSLRAVAGQFLIVDGVTVASASGSSNFYDQDFQLSYKSGATLVAPLGGSLVQLKIFAGWDQLFAGEAPTQSLRTAQLVAYPG